MWWIRRRDEDFHQEIDAHIALETDRLIAEGIDPEEARSVARRTFGNITRSQELFYDSGRLIWLEHLRQDLRYALRLSYRHAALTTAVVFTIAMALAANASLFAIFDGVLFRPLPYPDAEAIVAITVPDSVWDVQPTTANRQRLLDELYASPLLFEHANAAESPVFFAQGAESVNVEGLSAARATPSLFALLGVESIVGRVLSDQDWGVYAPEPAVIGYNLWQTRFGGDPAVVDQIVDLPGHVAATKPVHIVGVLPQGFEFPPGANVWHVMESTYPQRPQFARLAPAADPLTIVGVVVALVTVAWVSALLPARRASMIDPSVVLRDA